MRQYDRMVRGIAYSYCKKHSRNEFDDLYQEGLIGLWRALEKYKDDRNASIATYARYRIHGHILDYIRLSSPLSRCEREYLKKIRILQENSLTLDGIKLSDKEMAEALGINLEKYNELILLNNNPLTSLDTLKEAGFDVESRDQNVVDKIIEEENKSELLDYLRENFSRLSLTIGVMYFVNGKSLSEISEELNKGYGLVATYISRISKAIKAGNFSKKKGSDHFPYSPCQSNKNLKTNVLKIRPDKHGYTGNPLSVDLKRVLLEEQGQIAVLMLSAKEKIALEYLLKNETISGIGRLMGVSRQRAYTHVSNVKNKLLAGIPQDEAA